MSLPFKQVQQPEGINVGKEHPLKEFFVLLSGLLAFFAVIILVLGYFINLLAPKVPFSVEQNIADTFLQKTIEPDKHKDITRYLQSLADQLVEVKQLPEDISITVHFIDADTVNAFATLGGHVFFFRGLLEKMPNENALQMVMAHEIAHITHRHPIQALGRAVVLGAVLAILNTSVGSGVVENVLGDAGILTALHFSREHEEQADVTALTALAKLNGHLAGSDSLFKVFENIDKNNDQQPEFFSSHPHPESRIENISIIANKHGWKIDGPITPLPEQFSEWIKSQTL